MRSFFSRQFMRFILTGGTAAAVNIGSRIYYNQWLSYSHAIIAAYITGMITAFILARLFVFRQSTQAVHKSILFFCLVNGFAVLQTWAVSLGLAYYALPRLGVTQWVPEIAHTVGVIVPVFSSYLGHKRWSFR